MFKLTKSYLTRETNKSIKGLVRNREIIDNWDGEEFGRAREYAVAKVKALSKEVETFNNRRQELADAERLVKELRKEIASLKGRVAEYESGVLWLWRKMND